MVTLAQLMQKIETLQGKLLFLTYQLSQERVISQRDRRHLKDLIVTEEPKLFALMKSYRDNGTPLTLRNQVLQFIWAHRGLKEPPSQVQAASSSTNSSGDKKRKGMALRVNIPPKNIQRIEHRTCE